MGGPLVFAALLACAHVLVCSSFEAATLCQQVLLSLPLSAWFRQAECMCSKQCILDLSYHSHSSQKTRRRISIGMPVCTCTLHLQLYATATPSCCVAYWRDCFLLQSGKLHFGVILGWSVAGSTAVWFVVNNMAGMESPDSHGTGLYDCTCLLGYGMLPMVLHALLCLLVPR